MIELEQYKEYIYCEGIWKYIYISKKNECISKLFFNYNDVIIIITFVNGIANEAELMYSPYKSLVSLRKIVVPEIIKSTLKVIIVTDYVSNTIIKIPWECVPTLSAFYSRLRYEKLKIVNGEFKLKK